MSARRTRWLYWTRRLLLQSILPAVRATRSTEKGNGRHAFVPAALALGAALIVNGCAEKAPAAMAPPSVSVVKVIQKDIPLSGDWVATLDGFTTAQIQPEVSGYLVKQDYREGSFVHQGEALFEIDPRPFQAILDQAKGQLAQANAQLGLATINVSRDTPVAKLHAIPQSQLDNDIQAKLAAEAAVQTGEAVVEQAELNLGFTKVRSLIDGIAGIAQTQIGSLVGNTTILTIVSKVDPIKAYFPISEQEYLRIADKISGTVNLLSITRPVPLELVLSDGRTYSQKGKIIFADRQVDPQLGTIRMVGSFPNPGNILRPGQFGRVRTVTEVKTDALLVPQRAVTELQGNYQVATVGDDDRVAVRRVSVGQKTGTMWIIADGLKPGDRVITEGLQKVADGLVVRPVPDTTQDRVD
jgi:RND family efflux transporter MFP subunit